MDVSKALRGTCWAIHEPALTRMIELAESGLVVSAKAGQLRQVSGGVAVLPIHGPISQRSDIWMEIFGGASTETFGRMFDDALADKAVGAIVLDVDSPGGSVYGTQELAEKILAARGTKPIIAVANSLMASAAYWIGAAADQIVVAPGGEVGSVGVIAIHTDYSGALAKEGIKPTLITAGEHKAESNPYEPLGDEAREEIQRSVNRYYEAFTGSLAKARGVSKAVVKSKFGQGRVMGGEDAIAAGMADRIGTLSDVVGKLAGRSRAIAGNKARAWSMRKKLDALHR